MKKINEIPRKKIIFGPVEIICSPDIQKLCLCPYYGHPKGCPNYGKRPDCPPKAPYFLDLFQEKAYVALISFDFEKYLSKKRSEKRKKHPVGWTERALRNPRHWQGHLRSELKKFIAEMMPCIDGDSVILNPEGMGVNVTVTCAKAKFYLEWPPEKKVCCVALIAKKKIPEEACSV